MGAVLASAVKAAAKTTTTKTLGKTVAKTAIGTAAPRQAVSSTVRNHAIKQYAKDAGRKVLDKAPEAAMMSAARKGDGLLSETLSVISHGVATSVVGASVVLLTTAGIGMAAYDRVVDSGMGFGPWIIGQLGFNIPGLGLSLPGLPSFGGGAGISSPLPGVTLEALINYQPTHGQSFGPETGNQRSYGPHGGVDFDCSVGGCAGAKVAAMMAGTVTATEVIGTSANGNSYRVIIEVQDWLGTTEHRYVHVDSLAVGVGDNVSVGQVIAKVSPTDSASTGPHLDLKIWNGSWINPQDYMRDAMTKMASTASGNTDASPMGIYKGLKRRGMSPVMAAAFVGNIGQESGFNPAVVNSIGAAGLVQWLDGRRQRLNSFAASKGTEWTDVDTQLDFILHELNGSESAAYTRIKAAAATGDLVRTTDAIAVYYERMGSHEKMLQNRVNYAQQVYGR